MKRLNCKLKLQIRLKIKVAWMLRFFALKVLKGVVIWGSLQVLFTNRFYIPLVSERIDFEPQFFYIAVDSILFNCHQNSWIAQYNFCET